MTDRLTKFNEETGEYEYKERAKTQEQFNAQRKAVIQRLGEFEDKIEQGDVVEVRHGHWIDKSRNINGLHDPRFDCSVCGHIFWFQGAETFNYCPACGAKMDGERSENGKS